MVNLNAKVEKGRCENIILDCGLGTRNDREERINQFARVQDLVITNRFFKQHQRRLYTWKSNAKNENRIIKKQIDFFMIEQRFRNIVKAVRTYPDADLSSDHNPLVATIQLRLERDYPQNQ